MAVTINGSTGVQYTDDVKQKFGTGNDLEIFHDGQDSYIKHVGTDDLWIVGETDDVNIKAADNIILQPQNGENGVRILGDAGVELYYNSNKTFATGTNGATVFGTNSNNAYLELFADQGDDNNDKWMLVAEDGGSVFSIQNYNSGSWEKNIECNGDGNVELYYNGGKKAYTYSEGLCVEQYIRVCSNDADSHWGVMEDNGNNWNLIQNNHNDAPTLILENTHDSAPNGLYVYFSDDAPDDNTQYAIQFADNVATRFRVYSDGDTWTSDAGTLTSDETLKENITDATSKLEDIKKLKVRNFNWKESYHPEKSKKKQIGFIAQEVEEVFPGLVKEYDISPDELDPDHTPIMKKTIKAAWDPIIIKAMQELIEKVETLETKVAALEAA